MNDPAVEAVLDVLALYGMSWPTPALARAIVNAVDAARHEDDAE
jgi:hypothetical protein